MPNVTLPDGSVKVVPGGSTALDVAKLIGARLAKDAVGAKIDGELRDLNALIPEAGCRLDIVTPKKRDGSVNPDALFLARHSAAHVMAEAIQDVVGKDVLLAYGPPTDTGFFYDMYVPEGKKLSSDLFEKINARMAEIIKEDRAFFRYELPKDLGLDKLKAEGSKYKLDNAYRALEAGAKTLSIYSTGKPGAAVWIPSGNENVIATLGAVGDHVLGAKLQRERVDGKATSNYTVPSLIPADDIMCVPANQLFDTLGQGHWEDLCRGPHVPSTGRIGAARVMSLAAAYWHGDEDSAKIDPTYRLTRVYGTAFFSQGELDAYLNQLDEAKKRDHRVIGKQLRLFHIDEDVGQGLILWTPKGSIIRRELQTFIAAELRKQGYTEVFTPHIGRLDLYKTSGHFPYYKDSQFPPIVERDALDKLCGEGCSCAEMLRRVEGVPARLAAGINERTQKQTIAPDRVLPDAEIVDGFMLKPMNCPHHAKIFASAPHSYRDMPVRLAEFGTVYRWEQSGELNGMTRVRGFTQDDAHLFCTEEQVAAEIQGCLSLVKIIFATLGMKDYRVRVGLRDADSRKYTGSPEHWDKAEKACLDAAASLGVAFSKEPGEAAFYGPKIDFVVKDVIGREWQLGTVQVDYQMALRFDLSYVGADNARHRPVVIHRAPFGSMERFCGVLIEHFAGAFPTWLSPEQVRVLPISDKSAGYAREVENALAARGVRVAVDDSNDRIQAKVKVAADEKVPYMLVVGPRDAESRGVSVRARGVEKDLGAMSLDKFVEAVAAEIAEKRAELGVRP
jgi:threonyl-tRNA synthetase